MNHPPQSSQPHPLPSTAANRADPATSVPVMRWFGHLLATRPMAFWGGIWVSTFLIGVVAFGSLLSPSASERRSVSAIALGSDSGVATQPLENRGKVPLWMFGAIAVTCTAGSILVSRQLKPGTGGHPSGSKPRRVKRKPPAAVRTATAVAALPRAASQATATLRSRSTSKRQKPLKPNRQKSAGRQPQRLKPYSPTDTIFPIGVPQSPLPPQPAIAAMPAKPQVPVTPSFVVSKRQLGQAAKPVAVTVVPAEHAHPLDWHEPRLADDLDVRKQRSIQSLL